MEGAGYVRTSVMVCTCACICIFVHVRNVYISLYACRRRYVHYAILFLILQVVCLYVCMHMYGCSRTDTCMYAHGRATVITHF